MSARIFAPAKINLTLHVTGQRPDGYHTLDSLVCFVDVGDQISGEPAEDFSLRVVGPQAAGIPEDDTNLVMKAARCAGLPMAVTLDKSLPVASGIGGGSADAAATLRLAARLGADAVEQTKVLGLGADVPVCLASRPARMRGVGDEIDRVSLPPLHMVLVNPNVPVATPEVFDALAQKDNAPMPDALPEWPDSLSLVDWLGTQRNDLERAACKVAPEVAAAMTAIALSPKVLLTRMSGSGATCFGLYPTRDAADFAANQMADGNPWWWVKSASTMPG